MDTGIEALKRILFRRGALPRADMHDILDRVRSRFDEVSTTFAAKRPVAAKLPGSDEELRAVLLSERREQADLFFKLLLDETGSQWDRIVDRRAAAWFYNVVFLLLGFMLGKI